MKNTGIGEKLIEILAKAGVSFKQSSHELIFEKCYNCQKQYKLYAQTETGLFLCFRCEEKGNAVKLLAKYLIISYKQAQEMLYGDQSPVEDVSIETTKKEILENIENSGLPLNLSSFTKKSIKSELKLPEPIFLLPEAVLLTASSNYQAWSYLISRGYTPEIIHKLKLYTLPFLSRNKMHEYLKKKYDHITDALILAEEIKKRDLLYGRVIFPIYIDGEIYGYVARDYTGKAKKGYKAINSTGNFRSFFVWNFDLAKNSDELIICEGTTSAIKCGIYRTIALLGKMATERQMKLIRKTKAKKIFLCLDLKTDEEQKKMIDYLNVFYLGEIYLIKLPPALKINTNPFPKLITILKKYNTIIKNSTIEIDPDDRKVLESNYQSIIYEEKLSQDEEDLLEYIVYDAEYLDAGDYTYEEMEDFKKKAIKI